jgi:hypothetical protein
VPGKLVLEMGRREVITLLGGATAWPVATRAQQPEAVRRIGILMNLGADDAEGQARLAAFQQELQRFGWTVGVTFKSTPDGRQQTTTSFADMRQNWWRQCQM